MATEDRYVHWRTIIDNQAAGGMNIATYCRESHIHPSLFWFTICFPCPVYEYRPWFNWDTSVLI
jgi:hypothetical protein